MLSRGGVECGLSSYRLTKIPITVIQGCSEMARVEIAKRRRIKEKDLGSRVLLSINERFNNNTEGGRGKKGKKER